jgi:hypothetical protein
MKVYSNKLIQFLFLFILLFLLLYILYFKLMELRLWNLETAGFRDNSIEVFSTTDRRNSQGFFTAHTPLQSLV